MKYDAKPTPLFKRQFKKLHKNEQKIVAQVVEYIKENPTVGEPLRGAILMGYKSIEVEHIPGNFRMVFRVVNPEAVIHLIVVGPHRTVYEEATRYVKTTKMSF